jgi:hypothetical protein
VITIAEKPCDIAVTGARTDAFGTHNQLYESLASAGSDVAASTADFRPTDQQAEVDFMLRTKLGGLKTQFAQFVSGELAAFAATAGGCSICGHAVLAARPRRSCRERQSRLSEASPFSFWCICRSARAKVRRSWWLHRNGTTSPVLWSIGKLLPEHPAR